jgi:hypothetical protein
MLTDSARRFTENRHVVRVAAKGGDIPLHPLQARNLIEQSVIAGHVMLGFCAESWVREEPQRAEAVRDTHHHYPVFGELLAAVERDCG